MLKNKEELNVLKTEYETELKELTVDGLDLVNGGISLDEVMELSRKARDYYKNGYIEGIDLIAFNRVLQTGDNDKIKDFLLSRTNDRHGVWKKLYLEFSSYID